MAVGEVSRADDDPIEAAPFDAVLLALVVGKRTASKGAAWIGSSSAGKPHRRPTHQHLPPRFTDKTIKARISRADVAEFMLKQLADDTYLHRTPGLVLTTADRVGRGAWPVTSCIDIQGLGPSD